jgi:hypothetical protein
MSSLLFLECHTRHSPRKFCPLFKLYLTLQHPRRPVTYLVLFPWMLLSSARCAVMVSGCRSRAVAALRCITVSCFMGIRVGLGRMFRPQLLPLLSTTAYDDMEPKVRCEYRQLGTRLYCFSLLLVLFPPVSWPIVGRLDQHAPFNSHHSLSPL